MLRTNPKEFFIAESRKGFIIKKEATSLFIFFIPFLVPVRPSPRPIGGGKEQLDLLGKRIFSLKIIFK